MNQLYRTTAQRLTYAASLSRHYHTIQAVPREISGPRISARDRAQGRIPAVVFTHPSSSSTVGISRKHLLTTEKKQIQSLVRIVGPDLFCSTTFKLQVRAGSGSSVLLHSGYVLPLKLHRDAETGKVLNLVFAWADEGSHLTVDIPVVIKGASFCPGILKGGRLNAIRKSLKYRCPAESIPQMIEVDISDLDIGDRILLKDIQVDPSLKLLSGNDTKPVCRIVALEEEKVKPVQT
ncbi:hypothetical protein KSS87_007319 [Heliosperma pusillum]|nr:hypothetical protein KSS87_007319 [Heliosperma pusillum]